MPINKTPVFGVGINDAEYPVTRYEFSGGKRKQVWKCQIYRLWQNMLARCYSDKCKQKHPTYLLCTCTPDWLFFSRFRDWVLTQDWEGKELDKDLLFPGSKIYSPQTCIFVSQELNRFITDHGARRGEWPIGVSRYKNGKSFLAHCNSPVSGKCEYLGSFRTPEAAHEAWRHAKHSHALRYAYDATDERLSVALSVRYLPIQQVMETAKWAS